MLNLEQAIKEWRGRMLAAGVKSPVPLDELEGHLREDIEQQMKSGLNEHEAFSVAVRGIGSPDALKNEFRKNEGQVMKPRLISLIGVLVLLLGTIMILPALGKHKQRNHADMSAGAGFFGARWAGDELFGLAWGVPLAVGGASTALYGYKKRKTLA
jgi:hypothetical protein